MKTNFDNSKLNIARISESGFEVVGEVKMIPRGTFADTIYEVGLAHDGRIAENSGD